MFTQKEIKAFGFTVLKMVGLQVSVTLLLALGSALPAMAANKIPLKPDSANAAPCTVYGSATPGLSCGKTTAPAQAIDVAGNTIVSGFNLPTLTRVGSVSGGGIGQGIYASTTIPATSEYETLLSSGSNLLMTSTPNISVTSIVDGQEIVITSTDTATITLQDEGTLTGSKLELGAASRAITAKKVIRLKYISDLGKWIELSYGNN